MCDVALDPYTSHGQDGLVNNKYVLNDETVEILKKQSLLQAEMYEWMVCLLKDRIKALRFFLCLLQIYT